MAKINFKDITNLVKFDQKTAKYNFINNIDFIDYDQRRLIEPHLVNNAINLKTISDIVIECYPFVNQNKQSIIDEIIERNKKINDLIYNSIETKKGFELDFDSLEEKDKNIIRLAKSAVYDINKFIYKFEIKNIYANKVFINDDIHEQYIGNIDLIAQGKNGWYIGIFKMSKRGYNKKYFSELYLQKQLFETNTGIKINNMVVFNPCEEQVVINYQEPSTAEKVLIKKAINQY